MNTGQIILFFAVLFNVIILAGCRKLDDKTNADDSLKTFLTTANDTNYNTSLNKISGDSINVKAGNDSNKSINSNKHTTIHRNDTLKAPVKSTFKLRAYYFHPEARCETCRNIEAYSLEAIKEWEAVSNINVSWQELNIEDSVNVHYIDEYNIVFSSLIIEKYSPGSKKQWKNLEGTWKLVNDRGSFKKYVKFELNRFIKEN